MEMTKLDPTSHETAIKKAKQYKINMAMLHWLKAGQLTGLRIQTENHLRIIQVGRHLCRSCSPAPCSKQYQLQRQFKLLRVLSSWV